MSDLISKRAVLAKINLWANGELSTDKLIESIKKMHPVEPTYEQLKDYCHKRCLIILTDEAYQLLIHRYNTQGAIHLADRPCSVCKHHTENGCERFECVFKGV